MEFPELAESQESLCINRRHVSHLTPGRIRREHPQRDLQPLVVCNFDSHRSVRRARADKDLQLLTMQRVKRIVHNHHIPLRRTQGIVRQSACIRIFIVSSLAAGSRWTATAGSIAHAAS